MKLGTFGVAAGLLAGLAVWTAPINAQPLFDTVHVNLPYTVTIKDKTLPPGEYTIEQDRDLSGNSRILRIYADNGMKFETSAMTIPTLDPETARHTSVILHQIGPDYYFDKIWIQGKDYGYEFPLPSNVKSREKEMTSVTVPAQYTTSQSSATTTASTTQPSTPPATEPSTPPVTEQPSNPPVTAQANPPAQPTEPQTTTPANPPQSTTPYDESNSANRSVPDNTSMPATSAGWLMMVLGGGSLSGLGLALRRRK